MNSIDVLFTIIGVLAGFGMSQIIFVVRITSKVSVNEANIKALREEWRETNKFLGSILDQNNKLLGRLSGK